MTNMELHCHTQDLK
uniref:Uncharacterized protein n=1 Tax=Anguilla anguilla TaxID=7936 RepID=A0A0E9VHY9_ANGAN